MPRLFVILVFASCFASVTFAQNELKQLLRYGDELFEKGDYYYAKEYYEKAMEIDNKTLSIQWNYAEILRAYQDYRGASEYYAKVFEKDNGYFYPNAGVYLAQMLQQQGKYEAAIEILADVLLKNKKDKKSEFYLAASQLNKSCTWALSQAEVDSIWTIEQFHKPINSDHSEFPHAIVQGKLLFSSLRTDSVKISEEVYASNYRSRIFTSENELVNLLKDLANDQYHVGNGAFSLDSSRYYFSMCQDSKLPFSCQIYVARYSNGNFSHIDVLGEIINAPESSTTQPAIGKLNGEECLFFASNRAEGKGGMDIYYSIVKNGNQYGKAKAVKTINTTGNEVTPFYDLSTNKLFFSSDFHEGFGGFDIFYTDFTNDNSSSPKNLGQPINSPENDLYFLQHNDTAYFSSNRTGSFYAKNPTCCADIYRLTQAQTIIFSDTIISSIISDTIPVSVSEEVANIFLPVLYFHNDIPNPHSWSKTTPLDYVSTYNDYLDLQKEYQENWSKNKPDSLKYVAQIDTLYDDYIVQGMHNLTAFRAWLLERLEAGEQLEVVIRGFASPLTYTDYNVNLSMRRIQSLVNHLERFDGGVFKPYINGTAKNGGKLTFERLPFGEYAADQTISDDRLDMQNSVYAPAAALERRIEVEAVRFLSQPDTTAMLFFNNSVINLGIMQPNHKIPFTFEMSNRSHTPIVIEKIEALCDCTVLEFGQEILSPNEAVTVSGLYNTGNKLGHKVMPINVFLSSGQQFVVYLTIDVRK